MENFSLRLFEILQRNPDDSVNSTEEKNPLEDCEEYPFECCDCAELFFDILIFNQHNSKHQKNFPCEIANCSKTFKKASELRKHEVGLHIEGIH